MQAVFMLNIPHVVCILKLERLGALHAAHGHTAPAVGSVQLYNSDVASLAGTYCWLTGQYPGLTQARLPFRIMQVLRYVPCW